MSKPLLVTTEKTRTFVIRRRLRKKRTIEEINASLHPIIRIIRATRKLKRKTQRQFADETGYSHTHISDIERGHIQPKFQTIMDMINALGFDIRCVKRTLPNDEQHH